MAKADIKTRYMPWGLVNLTGHPDNNNNQISETLREIEVELYQGGTNGLLWATTSLELFQVHYVPVVKPGSRQKQCQKIRYS